MEVKNEKLLKDLKNFEEMAKMPKEDLEVLKKMYQNADSKFEVVDPKCRAGLNANGSWAQVH